MLNLNSRWRVRMVVRHLKQGGVIAYPTEAVFGLGCNPFDAQAIHQLLNLKKRSIAKGLILIAADWEQLAPLLLIPKETVLKKMLATWPGPTTWVISAQPWIPRWLKGRHESLAVRVTNHPIASDLCRAFRGPLVSTSANIAGLKPAKNQLKIRSQFGHSKILIVPGPLGKEKQTSRIIDAVSGGVIR